MIDFCCGVEVGIILQVHRSAGDPDISIVRGADPKFRIEWLPLMDEGLARRQDVNLTVLVGRRPFGDEGHLDQWWHSSRIDRQRIEVELVSRDLDTADIERNASRERAKRKKALARGSELHEAQSRPFWRNSHVLLEGPATKVIY